MLPSVAIIFKLISKFPKESGYHLTAIRTAHEQWGSLQMTMRRRRLGRHCSYELGSTLVTTTTAFYRWFNYLISNHITLRIISPASLQLVHSNRLTHHGVLINSIDSLALVRPTLRQNVNTG